MNTPAVTNLDKRAKLIDREDVFDAIAETRRDVSRVVAESLRSLTSFPTAKTILQRLRQVPVVERRVRLNAVREQLVNESIVKIETFRVRWTIAVGKHPRPSNREAIRLHAERLHQLHVALVEMVMIVRDVAV